jgi:hypothetical protein
MVGDLVSSGILLGGIVRTGRAKRPPFEADPLAVASELESMLAAGSQQFFMGHGGPLGADEVRRHAATLRELSAGAGLAAEASRVASGPRSG